MHVTRYKEQLLNHGKGWFAGGSLAVSGLFFGLTDPKSISSPMLFVGFILLCLSVYSVAQLGVWAFARAGLKAGRRQRRAVVGMSAIVMMVLALQSIGQLTFRDVAVIAIFAVLGYLYVTYPQPAETA